MTEAGISNTLKTTLMSNLIPYIMPKGFPVPEVMSGVGKVNELGQLCKTLGCMNILVVSDGMLSELGIVKKCTDGLAQSNVKFTVFDKVVPNCPDRLIMMGYNLYKHSKCD